MINPCTKECPDRTPGCECEKRRAWDWYQEQVKEGRRREHILDGYTRRIALKKRWIGSGGKRGQS